MNAGKGWTSLSKWRVGDLVEIHIVRPGMGYTAGILRKKRGRIVYVGRRFVTVRGPHFTECVWTDNDESNNIVIRRVSGG